MPSTPLAKSGYFGKTPILGDFIKYNLPRSFIEPWDDWLQSAIYQSKEELQTLWLDYFLTSPIYFFALTPGICDENSWLGLIMPSVDSAGRYFPLTLCRPVNEQANPFTTLSSNLVWCDKAEQLLLSSLKNNFSIEQFNEGIRELDQSINQISVQPNVVDDINEPFRNQLTMRHPLDSLASMPGIYNSLLHNVLSETCFAYSIWWTSGSKAVTSSFLLSKSLPPAESFAAFLDGNWSKHGWQNLHHPHVFSYPSPTLTKKNSWK
jgi:type VI secretion system protein ImpM